jgi:mannose-6-phosphate isomerase-like protein (cupin superfamily)
MDTDKYSIDTSIQHHPLELIDIQKLVEQCTENWHNFTLCRVNDCVVRLGVVMGEFHWHSHDREDEFFYVISGELFLDLEDTTIVLKPNQGFTVPRGVVHRTRSPKRSSILMIEGASVTPTGDRGD